MRTMYVYINFLTILDKGLKKNTEKRRDGEIGEQTKWNGSAEYEIEK